MVVSQPICSVREDNTAYITAEVSNNGYEAAGNVVIRVINADGSNEVLYEDTAERVDVGETRNIEYIFPSELMTDVTEDVMNAVYIEVTADSEESGYADNKQKVTFDSYMGSDVFTVDADAGYYSAKKDSAEKEGIIAFNSFFAAYDVYPDQISQYGIYIYKTGEEENKVTLSAASAEELTAAEGKFFATADEIPQSGFDAEVAAVPYVVLNGNTIIGNVCVFSVGQGNKWLGEKPAEVTESTEATE